MQSVIPKVILVSTEGTANPQIDNCVAECLQKLHTYLDQSRRKYMVHRSAELAIAMLESIGYKRVDDPAYRPSRDLALTCEILSKVHDEVVINATISDAFFHRIRRRKEQDVVHVLVSSTLGGALEIINSLRIEPYAKAETLVLNISDGEEYSDSFDVDARLLTLNDPEFARGVSPFLLADKLSNLFSKHGIQL